MKIFTKAISWVLPINVMLIIAFFVARWYPRFSATSEIYLVFFCLLFLIGISAVSFKWHKVKPAILLLNIAIFFFIVIVLIFELFFTVFPKFIPKQLLAVNSLLVQGNKTQLRPVEYLTDNPWIKFKPNTVIKSPMCRGDDFVYEWKTDSYGFKNMPNVNFNKNIIAVAIGDSFCEGMGVATEDTWESLATKRGYKIYNLGIQGYSPNQMVGVLEKCGLSFRPKYVIFCYTPGFELREIYFINFTPSLRYNLTGVGVNRYMKEERIAHRYFIISNAVIDYIKFIISSNLNYLKNRMKNPLSTKSIFYPYFLEVKNANIKFDKEALEFRLTKDAILETKKLASSIGAKTVVLCFAQRSLAYYKEVMKMDPPITHYELALRSVLEEFCRDNQIDFIDLYLPMRKYMESLNNNSARTEDLPYFKEDAHMNKIGQEIVADQIIDYFKNSRQE